MRAPGSGGERITMPDTTESAPVNPRAGGGGAPSEAAQTPVAEPAASDVEENWVADLEASTNPQPASDKPAPAQEQPESPQASAAEPETTPDVEKLVAERLTAEKQKWQAEREADRRREQSERDRQLHMERLRAQAEARAQLEREAAAATRVAAERQRLDSMDDAEYRAHMKKQEEMYALRQSLENELAAAHTLSWVNYLRGVADRRLDDADKAEFRTRDMTNQFQSVEEIVDFLARSMSRKETEKALKDKEKAIREAIEKERVAKEAEGQAPIADSGAPTSSGRKLSLEENILEGLIEEQQKASKRRR